MNKQIATILLFLCVNITLCFPQQNDQYERTSYFDRNKITLGGNLTLGFGNNSTAISIAPQAGYFFTPKINAGVGVSYSYYRYKSSGSSDKYHYAGVNVFGRIYPIPYIVLHAQPEINYMSRTFAREKETALVPAFVAGAGVCFNSITIMLQYDILQNRYSPYGSNIFYSVGFTF
jgi:hypothetical protein